MKSLFLYGNQINTEYLCILTFNSINMSQYSITEIFLDIALIYI